MRAVAMCAALVLVAGQALAQDPTGRYVNSPNAEWYGRQYSAVGGYCCTSADGHPYYGDYTLNADGSVTIPAPMGGTITIEASKVLPFNLKDPNPTGAPVLWYLGTLTADMTGNIFCFAIGPLT